MFVVELSRYICRGNKLNLTSIKHLSLIIEYWDLSISSYENTNTK